MNIDIDKAAYDLALSYASKYEGSATSTELALQKATQFFYFAYGVISEELQKQVALDEKIN